MKIVKLPAIKPLNFGRGNIYTHGASGFNRGCKCNICTQSNRDKSNSFRLAKKDLPKDGIKHGKTGYISYSCRCEICTEAQRTYCRNYYRKLRLSNKLLKYLIEPFNKEQNDN